MSQDLDQWHQRGRRYLHHGHSVFYQDQACGDGPTLLCIHGFPTASWDWHRIWGGLREHFGRIIAPDMIGFGFSDKPRNYPYAMPDQADLHVGLLLELGARDIHLLAHDIGDTVTQELLARLQRADAAMPSNANTASFLANRFISNPSSVRKAQLSKSLINSGCAL